MTTRSSMCYMFIIQLNAGNKWNIQCVSCDQKIKIISFGVPEPKLLIAYDILFACAAFPLLCCLYRTNQVGLIRAHRDWSNNQKASMGLSLVLCIYVMALSLFCLLVLLCLFWGTPKSWGGSCYGSFACFRDTFFPMGCFFQPGLRVYS